MNYYYYYFLKFFNSISMKAKMISLSAIIIFLAFDTKEISCQPSDQLKPFFSGFQ